MKKRILSILVSITLMVGIFSMNLPAVSAFENEDYQYVIFCNNLISIVQYHGKEKDVVVPSSIRGVTVAYIDPYAFADCTGVRKIKIADTISKIGYEAFTGCTNLTAIEIDSKNKWYTSVNGVLFDENKTSLQKYPAGLASIVMAVPNGVVSLEEYSFAQNQFLTSVLLPASLQKIAYGAFYDCQKLNAFSVDKDNTKFLTIDGVLMNRDKTQLIQYPIGNTRTTYTIPNTVTSIGALAFANSKNLHSITISNQVTEIEDDAFKNCEKVILYGTSGSYAEQFAQKQGLVFSTTDTSKIEKEFTYTIQGEEITVTDYTEKSTEVRIPAVMKDTIVTKIGDAAFQNCKVERIFIPNSIASIAPNAFANCETLTSITVDGCNQTYASNAGVLFNRNKTTLLFYPNGTNAASYSVLKSVTEIAPSAFCKSEKLKTITLPKTVTKIGANAFPKGITLRGYTGSYAEQYAKKNGILFQSIH